MKNIKIIYVIFLSSFYSLLQAQVEETTPIPKQETLANFQINGASENGKDITSLVVNRDYYLSLYKTENLNNLYFSVICESDDSQSYGSIYSIKHETYPNTETNSKSELYSFYWSYNNTYDALTGTAKIKLLVVYEPDNTLYTLSMQYENLEEYIYKGFIEGDLSSLDCEIKDNK
jgi:hypothetical protein